MEFALHSVYQVRQRRLYEVKLKYSSLILVAVVLIISSLLCFVCIQLLSLNSSGANANSSRDIDKYNAESYDPFGKFNPPVDISIVVKEASNTIYEYAEGVNYRNNLWTWYCRDKLGINVKVLWGVEKEQAEQKMNLTIASGEIPDIMCVNDTQFMQLLKADMIMPLDDIIDKYASDEVKLSLQNEKAKVATDICRVDGKLMAIPYSICIYDSAALWYIRKDWLDNLGLPIPQSMDELLNVVRAFDTQDPDGNGEDDTYGIALSRDIFDVGTGGCNIISFFNGYNAYPGIWLKNPDGQIVYGSIQPEVKTALKVLQELYNEGSILADFVSYDKSKVAEDVIANKVGVYNANLWAPVWPLQDTMLKNNNAEWVIVPAVSADGGLAMNQLNKLDLIGYNVVSKKCKNPEAFVRMLNLLYDILYCTQEGKYSEILLQGDENCWNHHWVGLYYYEAGGDNWEYETMMNAFNNGNLDEVPIFNKDRVRYAWKYINEKDDSKWLYYSIFADPNGSYGNIRKLINSNKFIYNEFYGMKTPTMIEKMDALLKMEEETFIKIIMGAPIETFDKFVNDWKTMGGNYITREVNEKFNK